MRILIDILHPAQVHFFKHAIDELQKVGHEVFVTARNIEVAQILLTNFNIPFQSTGKIGKSYLGLMWELFRRNIQLLKFIRKNKIDILMGISGSSIAMVGFLMRKPRIIFSDTEVNGIANIIAFHLATKVYTPLYFEKNLGKKHIRYNSLQEYTYLNAKYFIPDPEIPAKYGFEPYKYSICRFSSWKASHDFNQFGFSNDMKIRILKEIKKKGDILISAEGSELEELKPYLFKAKPDELHSFLAFSALLGVPVIRCNSLVGTDRGGTGNMKALEEAGLIYNFRDENLAFKKIKEILENEKTQEIWKERLDDFVRNRDDTVEVIVNCIKQYEYFKK